MTLHESVEKRIASLNPGDVWPAQRRRNTIKWAAIHLRQTLAECDDAIAAAKAEGAREAVERIRNAAIGTGTLNSAAFGWLNGILDEETTR